MRSIDTHTHSTTSIRTAQGDRNISFFSLSTAPNPPAPDQSRHNIEVAVRRGNNGHDGKDIDKARRSQRDTEEAGQTRLVDNAGVVRRKAPKGNEETKRTST